MGRHKCEAIACVSSQLQCIFFSIELLYCSFYYGEQNMIIWYDMIWFISWFIERWSNKRPVLYHGDYSRIYGKLTIIRQSVHNALS